MIDRLFIKNLKWVIGLGKICEIIFKKPLSKYEQCSNWGARPLRLA